MKPLPTDIIINGEPVSPATLDTWRVGKDGILRDLADFLAEWYAAEPAMQLHTSGSTGTPTTLQADKRAMLASAELSCRIFGLKAGQQALLCLPLQYVAGKMMVVRALAAGLHLLVREPSSCPMERVFTPIDFAAMVPLQAARTLAQPEGAKALERIGTLLLGGGFIDPGLEQSLRSLTCRIYASYGMTETLSHIALRRVNGEEASPSYTPLPGVQLSKDEEGALQLTVPHLGISRLQTNDMAELLPDGRFLILGRRDAVINSGGIKIQAEELENKLQALIGGISVLALPAPHPELGECVALLWEGPAEAEPEVLRACECELPKHHRPHHILRIHLPRTESGKPARAAARDMLPILLSGSKPGPAGFRKRLIHTLDELKQSKWWDKACDPKVQASICNTAESWLRKFGKKNKVALRMSEAIQLLRRSLKDKKAATPRNIIILTAVILYTITPLDGIPDILPVVGWLDDLGLLALAVKTVMDALSAKKSDKAPEASKLTDDSASANPPTRQ